MSIGRASQQRQATALAALAEEVLACRACVSAGYLAHANPIRPGLIDEPRIMLVGQAPGSVSDRKAYHFAGPAGRFLENWLDRAGFPPGYFRRHVYLSSLTRCFPGKSASGNGDRPPSNAEIALCRRFLDREIELLQPKLVLLVGKMAIDAFLGRRPLVETVGQVFARDGRLYLPLPHASGVSRWLNDPANRALLDKALAELSRLRVELGLATECSVILSEASLRAKSKDPHLVASSAWVADPSQAQDDTSACVGPETYGTLYLDAFLVLLRA